jgi:hypothetical protein
MAVLHLLLQLQAVSSDVPARPYGCLLHHHPQGMFRCCGVHGQVDAGGVAQHNAVTFQQDGKRSGSPMWCAPRPILYITHTSIHFPPARTSSSFFA